jgi:hypothetical protein
VVADGADEDVDAPGGRVGQRVDDLPHVEGGLPEVDEAYDGQVGVHTSRVLNAGRSHWGATSSLEA